MGEPGGARLRGIKSRDEAESVDEFIDGAASETPTAAGAAGAGAGAAAAAAA